MLRWSVVELNTAIGRAKHIKPYFRTGNDVIDLRKTLGIPELGPMSYDNYRRPSLATLMRASRFSHHSLFHVKQGNNVRFRQFKDDLLPHPQSHNNWLLLQDKMHLLALPIQDIPLYSFNVKFPNHLCQHKAHLS